MKFALHNPSWVFGSDPHDIFEDVKRNAQWAESRGFAMFSVMDHFVQLPGIGEPDEPFMEGWTVLSALAAVTSTIRLATIVSSVGFRNPALLAKMATGVDIISRGRLTLGMGAGVYAEEYRQFGWEFPRPALRIAQMEEAIRLIKTMWREKRATFHGRYFHVQDAVLEPKPVQKPHPPILIGGGGEQLHCGSWRELGTPVTSPAMLPRSSGNMGSCAATAKPLGAISARSSERCRLVY